MKRKISVSLIVLCIGAALELGVKEFRLQGTPALENLTVTQVISNYDEAGGLWYATNATRHIKGLDSVVEETDKSGVTHVFYDLTAEDRRVRIHAIPALGIKVTQGLQPADARAVLERRNDECVATDGVKTLHGLVLYGNQKESSFEEESKGKLVTVDWLSPVIGCRPLESRVEHVASEAEGGSRRLVKNTELTSVSFEIDETVFVPDQEWMETPQGDAFVLYTTHSENHPPEWALTEMVVEYRQRLNERYLANRRRFGLAD